MQKVILSSVEAIKYASQIGGFLQAAPIIDPLTKNHNVVSMKKNYRLSLKKTRHRYGYTSFTGSFSNQ